MLTCLVLLIQALQASSLTLPLIKTTGTPSCQALSTLVAQLVPAQPVVGLTTATLPVNLLSPIAA